MKKLFTLILSALFLIPLTLAANKPCSSPEWWGPMVIEYGDTQSGGCILGYHSVKSDDITFACNWDPSKIGKCKILQIQGDIYNGVSGDNENGYLYTVMTIGNSVGAYGADQCLQSGQYGTYAVDSNTFNAYRWSATGSNNLPIYLNYNQWALLHVVLSYRDNDNTQCSPDSHCVINIVSSPYILGAVGVYYQKCCPEGYEYDSASDSCKPPPVCGDNHCDPGEDCSNCPQDCGSYDYTCTYYACENNKCVQKTKQICQAAGETCPSNACTSDSDCGGGGGTTTCESECKNQGYATGTCWYNSCGSGTTSIGQDNCPEGQVCCCGTGGGGGGTTPQQTGCEPSFTVVSCPGYVQVNSPFTISYSFEYAPSTYTAQTCEQAYVNLTGIDCNEHIPTSESQMSDEGSFSLKAPSSPTTLTYTLKLVASANPLGSCSQVNWNQPNDTRSCTIHVVKDTTPPTYGITLKNLECE